MIVKNIIPFILLTVLVISCQQKPKFNEEVYINSVKKWQEDRLANLKAEDGWLNLVGLLWLEEGENTIGSDQSNSVIFPDKAPGFIGSITLQEGKLNLKIKDGVEVYSDSIKISETELFSDADANTTVITHLPFQWYIIKRGDRFGIRLRDFESPLIDLISEIPCYPIDPNWRIEAKFEKFDVPQKITIPDVLGNASEADCYGDLVFTVKGKEYRLKSTGDGTRPFFIIFADETSAETTYGAGRFLVTDEPDADGNVIIDFNRAYNPPCAFTDYATCPLPPRENILKLAVTAGEQINEHIGHH